MFLFCLKLGKLVLECILSAFLMRGHLQNIISIIQILISINNYILCFVHLFQRYMKNIIY